MERIKYDEDIELAIGPARIRKKRYYLLPTPQYQQPQAYYGPDGSIFWAQCLPQQQVMQPAPVPVQVVSSSNQNYGGSPVTQQGYATPASQPTYVAPVSQAPYGTPVQQPYSGPLQQSYSSSPVQQNYSPPLQQGYGQPVVLSVVTSEAPNNQSPPCIYQTSKVLFYFQV